MTEGEPGRRVIDGRFALEARLGGGGMGMVWRARDLVLDRAVALKEVRPPDPELAEFDPQAAATLRARVLREARALARVDHPGVVTIHHVVDGGEHPYPWLVMELVTGGSLADRLARGPMAPRDAARLGRELLAALRAAHEAGIEHRDVKPANVLLRPDGRPVLTDFGIAAVREATALTATGSVIGTPDYMAPERISGQTGGPGADLWSLAMMLYVAVEGRHPLRKDSTLATLAAVLNEELPPPAQAGPLTAVLTAALRKDPAARPSAAALDALLAAVEGGHPVPQSEPADAPPSVGEAVTSYRVSPPSAPTGPVEPPRDAVPKRPVRRGRRIALAASVAAAVLTGVLVATVLPWGGDGDGDGDGDPAAKPSRTAAEPRTPEPTATPARNPETEGPDRPAEEPPTDLLTPDGIRTAVEALREATGTDRMSSFTVHQTHVSANVMVDGSDSRYDSWSYRPERGAEKGIIQGSVGALESPFSIDDLDWDALPSLLRRADKELNVEDVTSRYLVVRAPDPTFDTPLGMAVYLSNDYRQVGFLEADPNGEVTRVVPNEGD
ncbi:MULTISPECIES: serine/threonine-protein kinase [unclassified Streptomyces]|uniref:serine/threonine-protein kinase n=1 Tax=unclassified Streptomyces TaxID=2593676 RepID=UPI0022B75102|nr:MULTISPECIES: serine/threonine protein kinase [unclassified Streptomyces]MCZ7416019.1 protein kinase [Streptomyces sp. WMMC897]MCZ7434174.1 protein kinase [Streptomyces sp. WMMC1477]